MTGVALGERFPSPLRYPGGKGKVANYIKLIMLQNSLVGSEYVEPYAGGASVALSLLFEDYADQILINDIDRSVYAFWQAVVGETEGLCDLVRSTRPTVDEWERQRAVQEEADPDLLSLGFSTLFLNRTSRSGIIRGGIIGGKDQMGPWKIDARYRPDDLVRRIRRIGRFRSRIELSRVDASHFLLEVLPKVETPLVYLDPPYYVKGGGLYRNSYTGEDHAQIATLVSELEVPWIVSYDAAPQIQQLYGGATSLRYDLHYSAQTRYLGSEVMFFAQGLALPDVASPANVRPEVVEDARLRAIAAESG